MNSSPLVISISNTNNTVGVGYTNFAHLEQADALSLLKTVSMYDIAMMISRATYGVAAVTYVGHNCPVTYSPVDNVLSLELEFYVWPSSDSLPYALVSNTGVISEKSPVEVDIEFSVTFGLTDVVDLGFMLLPNASIELETDFYSEKGVQLFGVDISVDGTALRASEVGFGVVRVIGRKKGFLYSLKSSILKDNVSITGLNLTVTSSWVGSDSKTDSETLKFDIPSCLADLLSRCDPWADSDGDGIPDWADPLSVILTLNPDEYDPIEPYEEPPYYLPRIAYFSECTGKLIGIEVLND